MAVCRNRIYHVYTGVNKHSKGCCKNIVNKHFSQKLKKKMKIEFPIEKKLSKCLFEKD